MGAGDEGAEIADRGVVFGHIKIVSNDDPMHGPSGFVVFWRCAFGAGFVQGNAALIPTVRDRNHDRAILAGVADFLRRGMGLNR